jgi:hypothetical protein
MFLNCSTCFGQHPAHHQELKTAIAASGFTYVFGCWQLRWLSHHISREPKTYVKQEDGKSYSGEIIATITVLSS